MTDHWFHGNRGFRFHYSAPRHTTVARASSDTEVTSDISTSACTTHYLSTLSTYNPWTLSLLLTLGEVENKLIPQPYILRSCWLSSLISCWRRFILFFAALLLLISRSTISEVAVPLSAVATTTTASLGGSRRWPTFNTLGSSRIEGVYGQDGTGNFYQEPVDGVEAVLQHPVPWIPCWAFRLGMVKRSLPRVIASLLTPMIGRNSKMTQDYPVLIPSHSPFGCHEVQDWFCQWIQL